ncbi:MAM protein, partial [Winogradskyella sp. 2Y89]|nr:MAM protein [Winogradskyella vincentii]
LTGKLDLEGESQLIQEEDSDLLVAVNGELERDQQGTADTFTYNYWSAPVGDTDIATNNYSYALQDIFYDGTNAVNFDNASLDGGATNPITIADYWIWKYANQPSDNYASWQHVRSTGTLNAGEGFTMKGPGTGAILAEQNYVYLGKPNNGDINLTIT